MIKSELSTDFTLSVNTDTSTSNLSHHIWTEWTLHSPGPNTEQQQLNTAVTISGQISQMCFWHGGKKDVWPSANPLQCWREHVGTFHWSPSQGGFDTPGGTSPPTAAWPGPNIACYVWMTFYSLVEPQPWRWETYGQRYCVKVLFFWLVYSLIYNFVSPNISLVYCADMK